MKRKRKSYYLLTQGALKGCRYDCHLDAIEADRAFVLLSDSDFENSKVVQGEFPNGDEIRFLALIPTDRIRRDAPSILERALSGWDPENLPAKDTFTILVLISGEWRDAA